MTDVCRIHGLSKTYDANGAPVFGAPPPGGGPPPAGPGAPPPAGPGDGGVGDGGGGYDGGPPMLDLFGDDGGGGYGQPPAERVPTTPQPRLGIVIQRSP